MANRAVAPWSLKLVGDGTSTSFAFTVTTAPLEFDDVFQNGFNLSSLLPSGVSNVAITGSPGVTSAVLSGLGTTLTVTFGTALGNNIQYVLSGNFLFY